MNINKWIPGGGKCKGASKGLQHGFKPPWSPPGGNVVIWREHVVTSQAYGAIWYFFYEYQKLVLYDGISWGETPWPLAMSVEVLLSTVMQQTMGFLDYLFTT
jgi:hypothetical protein